MYLSKLMLNLRSRRVMRELSSPYELHRTIGKAFVWEGGNAEPRILFRVEPGDKPYAVVLVQSHTKPDWSKLTVTENYFYERNEAPVQVKEFNPEFTEGTRYSFRLFANPTKRDNTTRKRIAISREEDIAAWMARKAEAAGFLVESLDIRKGKDTVTAVKENGEKMTATFGAALLQGVLRVTDSAKLKTAIASGIGGAKGFGFGLLSLAPLSV